jgi:hypothetical protein
VFGIVKAAGTRALRLNERRILKSMPLAVKTFTCIGWTGEFNSSQESC